MISSSSSNQSTISLNGKPIELINYSQSLIELKYYPNGISIPSLSTSLYFDKKSLFVQLQGNTSPNPIPDAFVFSSLLSASCQFNYYDVILPITTSGPVELLNIINGWLGYVSGITVNGGSTSELLNKINLIEGVNIAITAVPDAINNELGITISILTPLGHYGSFYDVTDQIAAVINTGYPILLGTTDFSNGVTIVSNSRITIANTGIYNIQWSGQFTNPLASEHDVAIWLRKNGVDVPGSAGVVLVPAKHGAFDGHTLPSWNYLVNAVASDYYELVWSTENLSVYLSFVPAASPVPSAASIILTVTEQI